MSPDLAEIEEREAEIDRLFEHARAGERPRAELSDALEDWSRLVWAAAEAEGSIEPDAGQIQRALNLARRPLFVCGVPRSGTTLMRDLLDGHPALCVLPAEGSFLTLFAPRLASQPERERLPHFGRDWLRRFANPLNRPPFWLLGRFGEEGSPSVLFARILTGWHSVLDGERALPDPFPAHVALVLAFADFLDRERGVAAPALWVDKTPTNERHLKALLRAFPEARVVHMVRDPYSVFASHRRMEERAHGSFRDVGRALRYMRATYRIAANALAGGTPTHLVVRYEDLIGGPERVMQEVAAFLGIAMDPCLLRPTVLGEPSHHNSSFREGGAPGAIHAVPAVDPRSRLSSVEATMVAAFTATAASALGYRPEPVGSLRRCAVRLRMFVREATDRAVRSVEPR